MKLLAASHLAVLKRHWGRSKSFDHSSLPFLLIMPDLIHIDLTKPFTESAYARPMMNYKRQEGNLEYKRGNFERAILL